MCSEVDEQNIQLLNNIGVGITGIAVFTGISKANVINRIKRIASKIIAPEIHEDKQDYEVDEMKTYVGRKQNECWITYAINRKSPRVIDFVIGRRTKENIGRVIARLKTLCPAKIITDKLHVYSSLVDKTLHRTRQYYTNRIERKNLTLRTHLKRLSRKTICFSKSLPMLENCLKIYFWKSTKCIA